MGRFSKTDYYAKEFGEAALAIALGKTWGFSHVGGGLIAGASAVAEAAMNKTVLEMHMRGAGGAALLSDSGLDAWVPVATSFVQAAVDASLLGRIPAAQPVGFNRQRIAATLSSSSSWTGEGTEKPIGDTTFEVFSLPPKKVSTITVVSRDILDEVADAADLIRVHLERDLVKSINTTFTSADAGDGSKPAGIGYGAQTVPSSGSTAALISADLTKMVDALATAGASLDGACWITSPQAGALFSLAKVADAGGMSMAGFPLLTSAAAAGQVILLSGSYLSFAVGAMTINTSGHADIVRGTTGTEHMFQENKTALMCESFVSWEVIGPTNSAGSAAVCTMSASYA